MHIDLFEALTAANVDHNKARAVVESLEAHMDTRVTSAVDSKLHPAFDRISQQMRDMETRLDSRFERLISSFRWYFGSFVAVAGLIVAYLKL